MRLASLSAQRTSKSVFAPRGGDVGLGWRSLALACGFAAIGLVLSLIVIFGPPSLAVQAALELGAILFVVGTIGLGFALAASLAE